MQISNTGQVQLPTTQPAGAPAAVKASVPAPQQNDYQVPPPPKAEMDLSSNEDKRQAQVQKAARAMQDSFVVSDVKFTIFKDMRGQYITRFTSLKDGSVTYIPEQYLTSFYDTSHGEDSSSSLKIQA